MLDASLITQLREIFSGLTHQFTLKISTSDHHPKRETLVELLNDVASTSEKISVEITSGDALLLELLKNGIETGVSFRAIPSGHEFSSLLLAILNADGSGKNLPDDFTTKRVQALKGNIHLTTYMSLTCTNCPDVVQALNAMAILNPNITHEAVDGALYQEEADAHNVQAVPTVFANGELLHVGRSSFGELLSKLEKQFGSEPKSSDVSSIHEFDVIVAGGGPAGSSAAIYSARKGLKVAVVAEKVGGQVNETGGIENLISVPKTTGSQLAGNLRHHMDKYAISIFENRIIEKVDIDGKLKILTVQGGEKFSAPALIIATGAGWRRLKVPNEAEFIGRGVAFCPHCDGPFYKDKRVAVVGGGNSGIEAAIDLAGICSKVTVFEFLDELKADKVLQEKAKSLANVEIHLHSQTTEVVTDGEKVIGLRVKDRKTEEEKLFDLDGVFVQIGLAPNSAVFKEVVASNRFGEIEIDNRCRTNIPGIYAAGDVTTVPYKQIIISMGEGAKAALTAFDDRIRGEI